MNENPLGFDPETMLGLGYRMVDMLVDRLSAIDNEPPRRRVVRERLPGL